MENKDTNKQAVMTAIWNNPNRAFGGQWRENRNSWEYIDGVQGWQQRGAVRLLRSRDGEGITVFFNHGSARAGAITDVFAYFSDELGTVNFWETLQRLADLYNITLEFPNEEKAAEHRAAIKRAELLAAVVPSLIEALRLNPNGATAQYITKTRKLNADGVHFGELTPDSLKRAKESLKARGKSWDAADFEALGLTEARARAGYNCVIPYYHNGVLKGVIYRNINATHSGPKYLYSEGLGRPGYCDRLTPQQPAVIVEGQIDAIRLIQQGIPNVIAMGGAKAGEEIGRVLRGRNISEIVYIPDAETDSRGQLKTKIINDAIRAFQSVEVEGEPVVKSLLLFPLPTPTGPDAKTDADTFGAEHPGELATMLEYSPVTAWSWEIDRLREQAAEMEQQNRRPAVFVQEQITDIYTRNRSPYDKQKIRDYVKNCDDLARYGVTPEALADVDEWSKAREYNNRVKQAAADLNKAVQEQANPETVGAIVRRLSEAQGANTRGEWAAQLSQTYDDELNEIKTAPDTLKTCWTLGAVGKDARGGRVYKPYESIEFFPSDISVFCAATSHGKTAILFQSALNLIRDNNDGKAYLFISCEENKRQLLERALKNYVNIENTETGKASNGSYCFIKGTRKKAIKAAITDAPAPEAYGPFMGESKHYDALKDAILREVARYGEQIRPRLKFIYTEAAAESITANILYYVEQFRREGVEVGGVFVDYMQLLTSDARNYSRHDELKDICKALKDCAARVELPVIIAAQLNREVLRPAAGYTGTPLDNITVANIGEGADIERIAHDIYLVWQTDKTPLQWYAAKDAAQTNDDGLNLDAGKIRAGLRSRRLFSRPQAGHESEQPELKTGYLYVEQLKARDGVTGGWGLLSFDGERGAVGPNDTAAMIR